MIVTINNTGQRVHTPSLSSLTYVKQGRHRLAQLLEVGQVLEAEISVLPILVGRRVVD